MSLAHRLKLLINSKEVTQSQFARLIGITRGSVNQWLSGKLAPGHKPLLKIFEVYPDISSDWLLLGRGGMFVGDKSSDLDKTFLKEQLEGQVEMVSLYKKLIEEKDARILLLESLVNAPKIAASSKQKK